jgi:hypothetical protein
MIEGGGAVFGDWSRCLAAYAAGRLQDNWGFVSDEVQLFLLGNEG